MLGPYYRGEKRVFTQEVDGTPAQVDILLRAPSGTETAYETTYNAVTGLWESEEIALLEGGKNWHKRANVWRADDVTPVSTEWEMFEVYGDPFASPYAQP